MSDFMAETAIQMRGNVGTVQFGDDSRLIVWFFKKSMQNGYQSQQQGRPIFEGKDFIHVQQPGERDSVERPVKEEDKYRFPRQWLQYQQKMEQVPDGTPLAVLFPTEPEIVDMLLALKVHTTEQLENLSEEGIRRVGAGARAWIEKAKKLNESARSTAPLHALEQQIADKDAKIDGLQKLVDDLTARFTALETARHGRSKGDTA